MRRRFGVLIGLAALAGTALAGRAADDGALRQKGKALYAAYCTRCHGDDGADTTTYPGAKTLVGITRRLSRAEVIQKSQGFAAVQFDEANAAALYAHLATLGGAPAKKPPLLVETDWLAANLSTPGVRIVDLRADAAFGAGHVPGAVQLAEGPLRNPADTAEYLPRPEALAELLGQAGIGNNTHVVAYDDVGGRSAARLWLVLAAYGHDRVSVVNGGWLKWAAEKRPISQERTAPPAARFAPKKVPDLVCAAPELLAAKPRVVVLDTRSEAEFKGEQTSGGAKQAGRVPKSVHVDWRENLTGPLQVFKPLPELQKLYEAKGVTKDREVITYCASGGRASHSLFALKLLGYPKVKVYYGSFADYTNRPDAPVER